MKELPVYLTEGDAAPVEVLPPLSPRKYWTRRGLVGWLVKRLGPLAETDNIATENAAAELIDSVPFYSAVYTGGIMPVPIRIEFRDAYQAAGITQSQAAEQLGLSRPHLENALAAFGAFRHAQSFTEATCNGL